MSLSLIAPMPVLTTLKAISSVFNLASPFLMASILPLRSALMTSGISLVSALTPPLGSGGVDLIFFSL